MMSDYCHRDINIFLKINTSIQFFRHMKASYYFCLFEKLAFGEVRGYVLAFFPHFFSHNYGNAEQLSMLYIQCLAQTFSLLLWQNWKTCFTSKEVLLWLESISMISNQGKLWLTSASRTMFWCNENMNDYNYKSCFSLEIFFQPKEQSMLNYYTLLR